MDPVERLYLDYNATSPLSRSVLDWLKSGDVLFANPSSQHSPGKAARKSINEARSSIYSVFGKNEKDTKLFFHSGATEAFLSFTHSFAESTRLHGKDLLVCYSKIDHPAVTSLAERFFGPQVKFFELKRDTDLNYLHSENLEALKDKKDNNPNLVILYHHLWVHNETGIVSPLNELIPFKTIPDLYLHIDAVQAPGKIPEWKNLSVGDIWSFSAHKFGALKGIGFSFYQSDMPFYPLISGGGQQFNLRSGTENTQGVKSVSLALGDLVGVDVDKTILQRKKLEVFLTKELDSIGGLVNGNYQKCSNTIYFYLNNTTSDIALALFDLNGLHLSAGSACSSGAAKASPVLLQMGLTAVAKNGLRLSFGFELCEGDLNKIETNLQPVFNKLRSSKN